MAAQPVEADTPDPIVARIRQGEHRDAVRLCAHQHGAAIGRFCTALLGNRAEGEEVAQETLVAAFRGMATFRGDGSVASWLFTIARRMCARRIETRVRREKRLRLVSPPLAQGAPDQQLEREQAARRIREALSHLKPSERDVLVLRYQAELNYQDIGNVCGIDAATARKRASRGLARLRTILSKEVR